MTRHELNDVFLRTSFLHGANATYLTELYARYQQDPGSVDPELAAFFAGLHDDKDAVLAEARGPSWARDGAAAPRAQRTSGAVATLTETKRLMPRAIRSARAC